MEAFWKIFDKVLSAVNIKREHIPAILLFSLISGILSFFGGYTFSERQNKHYIQGLIQSKNECFGRLEVKEEEFDSLPEPGSLSLISPRYYNRLENEVEKLQNHCLEIEKSLFSQRANQS